MRSSLTITPDNERRIQGLRSTTLGLETPVDLDYTTATNLLVELGFLILEQTGKQPPEGSAPVVRLPVMEVVRVLFRHIFQSMKDIVQDQDRDQLAKELIEREGGLKVLVG